jgi:hypothetical protein
VTPLRPLRSARSLLPVPCSLFPVLLLLLPSCAPTLPFHFTETAPVLSKRQVAVAFAGGGGDGTSTNTKINVDRCCAGGAVRVRVGLGGGHEVGAEVALIGAWGQGGPLLPTGKLRYKLALGEHFAFLAGLGFAGRIDTAGGSANGAFFGFDAGAVASTSPLAHHRLQLYTGARFTVSLPMESRFYENTPTQGFVIPAGLAVRANERFVFFCEGGLTAGFSEPDHSDWHGWVGGYGALALEYTTGP